MVCEGSEIFHTSNYEVKVGLGYLRDGGFWLMGYDLWGYLRRSEILHSIHRKCRTVGVSKFILVFGKITALLIEFLLGKYRRFLGYWCQLLITQLSISIIVCEYMCLLILKFMWEVWNASRSKAITKIYYKV